MRMKRATFFAATAVLAVLLTGCSGNDADVPPAVGSSGGPVASDAPAKLSLVSGTPESNHAEKGTGDWADESTENVADTQRKSLKWKSLEAGKADDLNPIVVNGSGRTLYRFDKDIANSGKSNCNLDCAKTWPPYIFDPDHAVYVDGIDRDDLGWAKRDDGRFQLTLKGWPLYRFSKDQKKGDTKGQKVGGTWFGIRPDGGKAEGNGDGPGDLPVAGGGQDNGAKVFRVTLIDDPKDAESAATAVSGPGCKNVRPGASSASAGSGNTFKLWSESDCHGRSVTITGAVADLKSVNFDNITRSVGFE